MNRADAPTKKLQYKIGISSCAGGHNDMVRYHQLERRKYKKMKYIKNETFEFKGVEISVFYYMEDGLYFGKITHVIQEPNGNIYEPGGGTSMDDDLENLRFKLTKTYLSNFYDGCKLIPNDKF